MMQLRDNRLFGMTSISQNIFVPTESIFCYLLNLQSTVKSKAITFLLNRGPHFRHHFVATCGTVSAPNGATAIRGAPAESGAAAVAVDDDLGS